MSMVWSSTLENRQPKFFAEILLKFENFKLFSAHLSTPILNHQQMTGHSTSLKTTTRACIACPTPVRAIFKHTTRPTFASDRQYSPLKIFTTPWKNLVPSAVTLAEHTFFRKCSSIHSMSGPAGPNTNLLDGVLKYCRAANGPARPGVRCIL